VVDRWASKILASGEQSLQECDDSQCQSRRLVTANYLDLKNP
jgi:hypothetical protein